MATPTILEHCWNLELEGMPQFERAMQRVYAWYQNEVVDRPPVRFMAHNAFLEAETDALKAMTATGRKAVWYDVEYQVDKFYKSVDGRRFYGETFPVYFPNLGPDVYAGFYGSELEFGEITSWSRPVLREWEALDGLALDVKSEYLLKIEELTRHALERCAGKFMVGYTDLHPGLDCAAAWRGPAQFCLDLLDSPEQARRLAERAIADFELVYDRFDRLLRQAGQLSVSWMGIPSHGRMHIPSCDFSTLISPRLFQEFALPILEREVRTMTHNVFHVDGRGVARHLDAILSVPEVHAVQWVQGVGDDLPIMQWVPLIKEIQSRKVPVIVDLNKTELEGFMEVMDPRGLFLWVATEDEEEEIALLKQVERWGVTTPEFHSRR